ncbi:MAG TPA: hypothetical protein VE822_00020 [Candidatus Elarobacter sp.]|nr:hypothetical protein [Candidatus Elarobacter sp.]
MQRPLRDVWCFSEFYKGTETNTGGSASFSLGGVMLVKEARIVRGAALKEFRDTGLSLARVQAYRA